MLFLVIINIRETFLSGRPLRGRRALSYIFRPILDTKLHNEYILERKNKFNYILCRKYHNNMCDDEPFVGSLKRIYLLSIFIFLICLPNVDVFYRIPLKVHIFLKEMVFDILEKKNGLKRTC